MAKDSRFKWAYRKNASRLHRAVGDLLRNNKNFCNLVTFQEYHVNRVNQSYEHGSHRFDWVIPKLNIVIECHGIQHYKVQTFGAPMEEAIQAFHEGRRRDEKKKEAALAAGYMYIVISYKEEKHVTAQLIFDKLDEARKELTVWQLENQSDKNEIPTCQEMARDKQRELQKQKRQEHLKSDAHKEQLERAKQYRKEQYQKRKEKKL